MYFVFLIKNCFELFSIFQTFQNEIKNQLEISVQTCTVIMPMSIFLTLQNCMASHDILHQTSCAYTPQQHVMTKCKNGHLVETTPTMLTHGEVHQHFWLSASYLIF